MDQLLPYALPERRGYHVVHVHKEGAGPCRFNPERFAQRSCRWTPTLLTRLRWRLAGLLQ